MVVWGLGNWDFTSHWGWSGGGGTDLERGYGDVQPWRSPFHASPSVRKGPISSKSISSQGPLLRKLGNFSLYSLNFCPNLSSQAPNLEIFSSQALKLGNFQFTSPKFGNFQLTNPPFQNVSISSQAPHFENPGRTPPTWKKLSAPPGGWSLFRVWPRGWGHSNTSVVNMPDHRFSKHTSIEIFQFEEKHPWTLDYT